MRFHLEKSDTEIFTSHAGLAIVGSKLAEVKSLTKAMCTIERRHGIANIDLVRAYIGLLAQGKNDFEAMEAFRQDPFFKQALRIKQMPSSARLRQRFDDDAQALSDILESNLPDLLQTLGVEPQPVSGDWIPLDVDLYPLDNSKTKKEGVSRTYKGFDGYGVLGAYLGLEGWNIYNDLREGREHPQRNFSQHLRHIIEQARAVCPTQPLLLRADAAHDANETLVTCQQLGIDYIIRWNPRKTDIDEVFNTHQHYWIWQEVRPGKRIGYSEEDVDIEGQRVRLVLKMTETSTTASGQDLLIKERELTGWWTNTSREKLPPRQVDDQYCQHATSEQFHSEIKSDMDLERLPSGKFATNRLIMKLAQYAYNILRWIGMTGLLDDDSPKRKKAQRRRIRTVMQEIIYRAAKVVHHARKQVLRFSQTETNFGIFERLYCC